MGIYAITDWLGLVPIFLKGKRIGIVGKDPNQALANKIKACGAEAVAVELPEEGIDNEHIINQDFKNDLNRYLQTYEAEHPSYDEYIRSHWTINDTEADEPGNECGPSGA